MSGSRGDGLRCAVGLRPPRRSGARRPQRCSSASRLLGALAAGRRSRIELGTMVLNIWNRQVGHAGLGGGIGGDRLGPPVPLRHRCRRRARQQVRRRAGAVGHRARRRTRGAPRNGSSAVLELCEREWSPGRRGDLRHLPAPLPRPTTHHRGQQSAPEPDRRRRADGDQRGPWHHPRRDRDARRQRRGGQAGARSSARCGPTYDPALLDPGHPNGVAMRAAAHRSSDPGRARPSPCSSPAGRMSGAGSERG